MHKLLILFIVCSTLLLHACSNEADTNSENKKRDARTTLVTVTTVKNQAIEITQSAVGSLEGLINPTLAAEMTARIIKVHVNIGDKVKKGQLIATLDARDTAMLRNEAQAEVARIQALLDNQSKILSRNQALVDKKFISQHAMDNEVAQENVLKQQLATAKARVASINHDSSKSKVLAPVSGTIESTFVDTGDFLKLGDPIVEIISKQSLRAHLPFPEQLGSQLRPGLTVRLKTSTSTKTITSVIRELKPLIAEGNRTIDAIADVNNVENWQPGASVTGHVVLDSLPAVMMVPEQSLVLRPAGEVIYIVREGIAYQAIVETGLHQNGLIEIVSGLKPNDVIVVDGAGFLTDKAPVEIVKDDAT